MGEHQLRLRELTDDWTPGRVLHLTGKAVKALGVPDGGHVVVQFLEYSPPLQPCDSVFWVLRRYVADGVAGVAWSVPLEWPPDELVVNGRPELGAPNFDDLRETVAVVRVTVDRPAAACPPHSPGHGRPQYLRTRPASVVIARLHPKKATWETIRPGKRRQVRAARAAGVTPDHRTLNPVSTARRIHSWRAPQARGRCGTRGFDSHWRQDGAGACWCCKRPRVRHRLKRAATGHLGPSTRGGEACIPCDAAAGRGGERGGARPRGRAERQRRSWPQPGQP